MRWNHRKPLTLSEVCTIFEMANRAHLDHDEMKKLLTMVRTLRMSPQIVVNLFMTIRDLPRSVKRKFWCGIRRASYNRMLGMSHRNFCVGGFAIGLDKDGAIIEVDTGFNTKYCDGGGFLETGRKCAEERLIEQAFTFGVVKLLAIWISAEADQDDHSGVESPTLHCCASCHKMLTGFAADPYGITDENLTLISATPARPVKINSAWSLYPDAIEVMTLKYQAALHGRW